MAMPGQNTNSTNDPMKQFWFPAGAGRRMDSELVKAGVPPNRPSSSEDSLGEESIEKKAPPVATTSELENAETMSSSNHPREGLPSWKWPATLFILLTMSIINGYDVSNVANIQPEIYKAFGDIDILPWVGLSYSASCVAILPFARKLFHCFDVRYITQGALIVFIAGAAVAGAANNMASVIVGRIVMGLGGGVAQQCIYSYVAILTTPVESPRFTSYISAAWALGLITGGPIGSAFAENEKTTWRWAIYINIPIVAVCFALSLVGLPSHTVAHNIPLSKRLAATDPVGLVLHAASIILCCLAITFSGAVWAWTDGRTIALWVVFGLVLVSYLAQQALSLFTAPDDRAFPVYLVTGPHKRALVPLWIATACAGCAYAVTLYYMPLYFAFARGASPLAQTVRLLPFILVFIVSAVVAGAALPLAGRYAPFYLVAGLIILSCGAALATILDRDDGGENSSDSVIMGLEALVGFGLGLFFSHGLGLSNVILADNRSRVDSLAVFNVAQLGGVSVMLAAAGSIYHNVGFDLLKDRLKDVDGLDDGEIREALAGVSSKMLDEADAKTVVIAVRTVTEIIAKEFYLLVATGAITILCALVMKWEKLDFGRTKVAATSRA